MATHISHEFGRLLPETRFEPTPKRIRALLGTETILDSVRAVLFWEPRRVVPCYAVPRADVLAGLDPAPPAEPAESPAAATVLSPAVPFAIHSCPGTAYDVTLADTCLASAAFVPRDPDLHDFVAFSFSAFSWLEEDEPVSWHPRDPFHRVDVRRSSARVRVSSGGLVIADSTRPSIVFETGIAPRYYLPAEDVNWQTLLPTDSSTGCAYKGMASYWALADGSSDVAWSYLSPLPDAVQIADMICFYDDRLTVDITEPGSGGRAP